MNTALESTTTTWQIDAAHTQIEFVVKHMMFATIRGRFASFSGEITHGPDGDLSSGEISAQIETASIETAQTQRDEHLRSADFFDADKFPVISFQSTDIRRSADTEFEVRGELTIRDVTKEVVLDVKETGTGIDPWGQLRIGLQATASIDRREFGLTWNQALEAGGVLVGNEINIMLQVQAASEAS